MRHEPGIGPLAPMPNVGLEWDTHVLYPLTMADREINRAAWAEMVETLLNEEAKGNKTAFAAAFGADRKTVNRWLASDVDVSEESVRAVARAFKLSPIDLLIKVGYYRTEDMQISSDREPDLIIQGPEGDLLLAQVKSANVRPSVKRDLVEYIAERRSQFEKQLAADVERLLAAETRARRSA